MKARAWSLQTGAGLTEDDLKDNVTTIEEKLEQMCPFYARMEAIYSRCNVKPWKVYSSLGDVTETPEVSESDSGSEDDEVRDDDAERDDRSDSANAPLPDGLADKTLEISRDSQANEDAIQDGAETVGEDGDQRPFFGHPMSDILEEDPLFCDEFDERLDSAIASPLNRGRSKSPRPEASTAKRPRSLPAALRRSASVGSDLNFLSRLESEEPDANSAKKPRSAKAGRTTIANRKRDPLPTLNAGQIESKASKHPVAAALAEGSQSKVALNGAALAQIQQTHQWRREREEEKVRKEEARQARAIKVDEDRLAFEKEQLANTHELDKKRVENEAAAASARLEFEKEQHRAEQEAIASQRAELKARSDARVAMFRDLLGRGQTPQQISPILEQLFPST